MPFLFRPTLYFVSELLLLLLLLLMRAQLLVTNTAGGESQKLTWFTWGELLVY